MANLKKIEACQIAYGDQYAQMVESSATRKKEKKPAVWIAENKERQKRNQQDWEAESKTERSQKGLD